MLRHLMFWCALIALGRAADAAKPTLELVVGETSHVGRCVARDDRMCWLQSSDGRLTQLSLQDVTSFRKVSPSFRSITVVEAREQLARELGRRFEVAAAGQYVVAAPQGKARAYADLLDGVHRSFTTFFSRRSFGLTQPEFPLMAVVYPDEAAFAEYCRADGTRYAPGLKGYYNPETNRIVLFDDGTTVAAGEPRPDEDSSGTDSLTGAGEADRTFATIQADLRDTLIHEATHQLAFNTGLHPRLGENPRWVVEGLAMIFEQEMGGASGRYTQAARINGERYEWFMQRARPRMTAVQEFVQNDRPFSSSVLDAYSEAWALTFYLSERRSADFAAYLQRIRARDSLSAYPAEERLADFQKSFGDDVAWLQVQWLRYMDELK